MKLVAALAFCLCLFGCSPHGSRNAASAAANVPVLSVVGDWICQSSSDKRTSESMDLSEDGHFIRWGQEKEGGWRVTGTYKLEGDEIVFETADASSWIYGEQEFAKTGRAKIIFHSTTAFDLQGPHGKDVYHKLQARFGAHS